jgi:hypothetical protein
MVYALILGRLVREGCSQSLVPFSMGTVLNQQNPLSNAFTSRVQRTGADSVAATAKLSGFLEQQYSRKF